MPATSPGGSSAKQQMHYNIVHDRDSLYTPWHASTYEYAQQLLRAITDEHPELKGLLTIIAVQ